MQLTLRPSLVGLAWKIAVWAWAQALSGAGQLERRWMSITSSLLWSKGEGRQPASQRVSGGTPRQRADRSCSLVPGVRTPVRTLDSWRADIHEFPAACFSRPSKCYNTSR
ncbi:hypothetical protein DFH27DRAFT_4783 [Peziza echinospora]|nr:hypothetical protein DFH27DRAFT_4783 [Peziza echinospora]